MKSMNNMEEILTKIAENLRLKNDLFRAEQYIVCYFFYPQMEDIERIKIITKFSYSIFKNSNIKKEDKLIRFNNYNNMIKMVIPNPSGETLQEMTKFNYRYSKVLFENEKYSQANEICKTISKVFNREDKNKELIDKLMNDIKEKINSNEEEDIEMENREECVYVLGLFDPLQGGNIYSLESFKTDTNHSNVENQLKNYLAIRSTSISPIDLKYIVYQFNIDNFQEIIGYIFEILFSIICGVENYFIYDEIISKYNSKDKKVYVITMREGFLLSQKDCYCSRFGCNQFKTTIPCTFQNCNKVKYCSQECLQQDNTHRLLHHWLYLYLDKPVNFHPNLGENFSNESPNSDYGLLGLQNLGNSCYMNSALQCILHCEYLMQYFIRDYKIKEKNEESKNYYTNITDCFKKVIDECWNKNKTANSKNIREHLELKRSFGKVNSKFNDNKQHDSNEFLTDFLNWIGFELRRPITFSDSMKQWEKFKGKENSIISDLFYGELHCRYTCNECSKNNLGEICFRETYEPFLSLGVPILEKGQLECTNLLKKEEKIYLKIKDNKVDFSEIRNIIIINKSGTSKFINEDFKFTEDNIKGWEFLVHKKEKEQKNEEIGLYIFSVNKFFEKENYRKVFPYVYVSKKDKDTNKVSCLSNYPKFISINEDDIFDTIREKIKEIFNFKEYESKTKLKNQVKTYLKDNIEKSRDIVLYLLFDSNPQSLTITPSKLEMESSDLIDCFNKLKYNTEATNPKCTKCGGYDTKNITTITHPPIYLCILLKRFCWSNKKNTYVKRHNFVSFPEEINLANWLEEDYKDKEKFNYELIALTEHVGGQGGGHYTCQVKLRGKWYAINDSKYSLLDEVEVNKNAYSFIFKIKDTSLINI